MQQMLNSTNTENNEFWNKLAITFSVGDDDPELSKHAKCPQMSWVDDEALDDGDDDQNIDIGGDWDSDIELDDEYPDIPFELFRNWRSNAPFLFNDLDIRLSGGNWPQLPLDISEHPF